MLSFSSDDPPQPTVPNTGEIPKEFDIFFRNEYAFLPPGKTFNDLTPEELATLSSQYRFDPLKPGIYQSLTGFKDTMG